MVGAGPPAVRTRLLGSVAVSAATAVSATGAAISPAVPATATGTTAAGATAAVAVGAAAVRSATATAQRTQAGLRSLLDARRAPYTAFWIADALRVTGDKTLVDAIAARSDVERIEPARTYQLVEPNRGKPGRAGSTGRAGVRAGTDTAEWGA